VTSDWPQIAALYGTLLEFEPTEIIQLNHAVAIAEAGALKQGFAKLETLSDSYRTTSPSMPRGRNF
jgi:RNA polymerase sigma-70 factor (ECF subfamily)